MSDYANPKSCAGQQVTEAYVAKQYASGLVGGTMGDAIRDRPQPPKEMTLIERIQTMEKQIQELFERSSHNQDHSQRAHNRIDNIGATMGLLF